MAQIKMLTGVVEVGVFCNMAKAAYFGNEVWVSVVAWNCANCFVCQDGSVTIKWNDGRVEQVAAPQ